MARKHDCDPCPGFAIFSTGIRPNGKETHAFQRCDECNRFATDADAVLAIVDVLTGTLGLDCDDLDGALHTIEASLLRLAHDPRYVDSDALSGRDETLSRVRALQAAIREAAEA